MIYIKIYIIEIFIFNCLNNSLFILHINHKNSPPPALINFHLRLSIQIILCDVFFNKKSTKLLPINPALPVLIIFSFVKTNNNVYKILKYIII